MTVKAHEDKTYPRRLHRVADAAVGLRRERRRGRRRLSLRVGARPLPPGHRLLAAGDRAAADRAVTWLFTHQQQADGTFPQNSHGRRDAGPAQHPARRDRVPDRPRLAARRTDDAHLGAACARPRTRSCARGPATPQERWEETGGYSPLDHCRARSPASWPRPTSPAGAATRQRARAVAGRRRRVAAQHREVDVHDQRAARRRPLLRPHRRRRRPQRRLRARLRQRRRRAQGERGRRRRLPRARPPRRQGAGRPVRRRLARRDRRVAGHRHAERARVAPLHLRRLRREGRRLAVGRSTRRAPRAARGRCSAASAASTRSPTAATGCRSCRRWPTPPTTAT